MRRVVIVTALLTLAAAALACAPAAPPPAPAAVVEQQTATFVPPPICLIYVQIKQAAPSAPPPASPYGITTEPVWTCYVGQEVMWVVYNPLDIGKKKIKVDIEFTGDDPLAAKVKQEQVGSLEAVLLRAKLKPKNQWGDPGSCAPPKVCLSTPLHYNVLLDGNPAPDPDLQVEPPPTIIIPGGNPPPKK